MVVANRFVYAVLGGRLADVVEDGGPVGHGLVVTPRAEAIAERVHVGVGADAWVTKQVPRAAHRLAPFEDDETLLRALYLQMAGRRQSPTAPPPRLSHPRAPRSGKYIKPPESTNRFGENFVPFGAFLWQSSQMLCARQFISAVRCFEFVCVAVNCSAISVKE